MPPSSIVLSCLISVVETQIRDWASVAHHHRLVCRWSRVLFAVLIAILALARCRAEFIDRGVQRQFCTAGTGAVLDFPDRTSQGKLLLVQSSTPNST